MYWFATILLENGLRKLEMSNKINYIGLEKFNFNMPFWIKYNFS